MCGTVRFECPYFHFSETLAAELCLTGQRLLRDERVWSDRACVNLVIDQVRELQHVNHADRNRVIEALARAPVAQPDLARRRNAHRAHELDDGGVEPFLAALAARSRNGREQRSEEHT